MTREEKQKVIDALKISAPVMAVTQEEFNDYIQTLNKIMDWLEQEPKTGYWIYIGQSEISGLKICKCSECGKRTYGGLNYCGNCGARMVEPQESEEME